jgi:hypothetical protein
LRGGINTYAYVGGAPISWFDRVGLDYGFSVDPAAAGGNGHTTLLYQNEAGDWFAFNQGAVGGVSSGGNLGFLLGLNAPAGVSISPIEAPSPGAIIYPSNNAQNAAISSCAVASQGAHNSGTKKYNLYGNNCTGAAVDVLACAGITVPNPTFTIKPNSWIKQLPPPPQYNPVFSP